MLAARAKHLHIHYKFVHLHVFRLDALNGLKKLESVQNV